MLRGASPLVWHSRRTGRRGRRPLRCASHEAWQWTCTHLNAPGSYRKKVIWRGPGETVSPGRSPEGSALWRGLGQSPSAGTTDRSMLVLSGGGRKSKSYGLGTGWISPQSASRCRWRRFPVRPCGTASPVRATRLPLSPHCNPFSAPLKDSLGDFHHSPSVSLASFAERVSGGDHGTALAGALPRSSLIHPPHARQATAAHSVTARRRMHRIAGSSSVSYTGRKYHVGSTSMHKNRSPRKQGRIDHAIGKRPESASIPKGTLPPSTHPKLGVISRHQRFHRCALQRIFRPSLGNGRSD